MENITTKTGGKKQIGASLPPKYLSLIDQMSEVNGMSKSSVVRVAVKKYFDTLPPSEIQRIKSSSHHY